MSFLTKLQAGSDKVQTKLAAKGLREHTVYLIAPPAGRDPDLGTPSATAPTPVLLAPTPKVAEVSLKDIQAGNGVIQVGDVRVSKVTRSSTFAALISNRGTIWRISGPEVNGDFSLINGSLNVRLANNKVILRRILT